MKVGKNGTRDVRPLDTVESTLFPFPRYLASRVRATNMYRQRIGE